MSTVVFSTVADYFAGAADMHRDAYKSFDGLSSEIGRLNSFLLRKNPQQFTSPASSSFINLQNKVNSTRHVILVNFSKIQYMEPSFAELAKYVLAKFGTKVDEMLTNYGVKVFESYKKVSDYLAEPISDSNVKEY